MSENDLRFNRSGTKRPSHGSRTGVIGWRGHWAAITALLLGYSGYFKGLPGLSRTPVDLTLLGALLGIGVVVIGALTGRIDWQVVRPVMLVWAAFVPGLVSMPFTAAAEGKAELLFTVTLLCALIPATFTLSSLRIWVSGQIALAAAMIFVLASGRTSDESLAAGRLITEGVTTVSSSRVVAGGVLIAVLVGVSRYRYAIVCGVFALVGVATLLAVGSRGPVASLLLALTVVALVSAARHGVKVVRALAVTALVASVVFYAANSRSFASQRIGSFLEGTASDRGRSLLYEISLSEIQRNPFGIGWGAFGDLPRAMFYRDANGVAYSHNMFLEAAVEGGLIAAVVLAIFTIASLSRLMSAADTLLGQVLLGSALYWVLVAQTSSDLNGNRLTWIALSIGMMSLLRVSHPRLGSSPGRGRGRSGSVSDREPHSNRGEIAQPNGPKSDC